MTVELSPPAAGLTRQTPSGLFVRRFLEAQSGKHVRSDVLAAALSRGVAPSTRPVAVDAMYSLGVTDTLGGDPVAGEVAEAVLVAWGIASRKSASAHRAGESLAHALGKRVAADKGRTAIRLVLTSRGEGRYAAVRRAASLAGSFDYGQLADDLYRLEKYESRDVARTWSSDYGK